MPYIDLQTLTSDPLGELTARERELLVALANGWTNLQIASRIGISRNTVKYHLKNLYDKLGVSNRAMAVALYMSADHGCTLNSATPIGKTRARCTTSGLAAERRSALDVSAG